MNTPIVLTNYNLKEAEKTIITACLENNPHTSLEEQADMLHISQRTLYRFILEHGLKSKRLTAGEIRALNSLKKKGYRIEEPETNKNDKQEVV